MSQEDHSEADDGLLQDLSNGISSLDVTPSLSNPDAIPSSALVSAPPIPPHRSHSPTTNTKRTSPFQFGQRYLEPADDVFEYNAWDHVVPDPSHDVYCQQQYEHQRSHPVSAFDRNRFNTAPAKWWDLFYKQKTSTFFKDRKWLRQEFPVLEEVTREGVGRKVVLEVGAGAGNTAFPIVRGNANPELRVHAVDFSKAAVETMRNAEGYQEENEKGVLRADVWDVAAEDGVFPEGVTEGSVDIVIMIFIFSALSPRQWAQAVRNIYRLLKPGGEVLFRDYGRGDLAQVRFKAGRWMEDNFYVRGDGTRVYFFEKEELERIWGGRRRLAEAPDGKGGGASAGEGGGEEEKGKGEHDTKCSAFEICNLDVDRRLIVNRQKRIKMYRCWIQGRFRKPIQDQESTVANTGNNAS